MNVEGGVPMARLDYQSVLRYHQGYLGLYLKKFERTTIIFPINIAIHWRLLYPHSSEKKKLIAGSIILYSRLNGPGKIIEPNCSSVVVRIYRREYQV